MKSYLQPTVEVILLTQADVFLLASVDNEAGGAHNREFEDRFN